MHPQAYTPACCTPHSASAIAPVAAAHTALTRHGPPVSPHMQCCSASHPKRPFTVEYACACACTCVCYYLYAHTLTLYYRRTLPIRTHTRTGDRGPTHTTYMHTLTGVRGRPVRHLRVLLIHRRQASQHVLRIYTYTYGKYKGRKLYLLTHRKVYICTYAYTSHIHICICTYHIHILHICKCICMDEWI